MRRLEPGHPTHVHIILAHGHGSWARMTHNTLNRMGISERVAHVHLHLEHRIDPHAHAHAHLGHAHLRSICESRRVGHGEGVLAWRARGRQPLTLAPG